MAIIYSYPKVTSPLATDVLVLTDTTLTAGKRKNKTKSLAMSDLAAYVVSSTSGITGSGTLNTIPLFTPSGVKLGNSIITQAVSGQGVTVTGQLDVTQDFNVTGSTELFSSLSVQGASTFSNVSFQGVVFDGGGNPGTAGQVLSSTGAGGDTEWINNTDANTTYNLFGATSNVNEYAISLSGSDGSLDKVNLIPGSNITLTSSATGVTINAADSDINGSGTANYITKWTDTDTIESASNLKLSSSTLLEFGDDFSDSARRIQVKADQYPEIRLENSDNFFVHQMRPGGAFAFTNGSNNARVFTLNANSVSNLIVTYGANVSLVSHSNPGNVGIGWSNPTSTPARLSLTGNGTTDIFNIYSDSVGTNRYMTVNSTGNVGIGTTSPDTKLEVVKDVNNSTSTGSDGNATQILHNNNASGTAVLKLRGTSSNSGAVVFGGGVGASTDKFNIISRYNHTKILTAGADGNVGIGTTSPSARLEVQGTNSNTQAAFKVTDSGDSFFEVVPDNNTTFKIGDLDAVGDEAMIVGTFSDITFSKGGTATMILDSNNRVGIGTTSPSTKLHVSGGDIRIDDTERIEFGAGGVRINNDASGRMYYNAPLGYYWQAGSGYKMTLLNSGNVGIGTTSPASKLEVDGGDIEVDDSASGLILRSPDGTRYRVTVANGGTLSVAAV